MPVVGRGCVSKSMIRVLLLKIVSFNSVTGDVTSLMVVVRELRLYTARFLIFSVSTGTFTGTTP